MRSLNRLESRRWAVGPRWSNMIVLGACLVAPLLAACGSSPSASEPCPTDDGTGCASKAARVDLYEPTFSQPTQVTNPSYPISNLHSVVFTGHVDGKPFRTETTLLPETKMIEWKGQQVETVVQQYMAFSDGRIQEIALDWFAQDDAGGVWYFGEDVSDYDETGVIYTHEGTWLVGRDGELALNMPAAVRVDNAWLAEDAAPEAWEQIIVRSVDEVRDGPSGSVAGIIVGEELKLDGGTEIKLFAPGYGEFSTGSPDRGNLEVLALAIPTDALPGPAPSELNVLAARLADIFAAAEAEDWRATDAAFTAVNSAWATFRGSAPPPLLEGEMQRLLSTLSDAVDAHDVHQARHEAIAVARVVYDFGLRYQPVSDIDRVRFDLWLAQVTVDGAIGLPGPIKGDVSTIELVWNRISHTFKARARTEIEAALGKLRVAADQEDASQAVTYAQDLRGTFADMGWH